MNEGLNPTRRYKWFRPRQAAFIRGDTGVVTNQGSLALYNNSTGAQVIIVRDIEWEGGNFGSVIRTVNVEGTYGAVSTAHAQPLYPGDGNPPGQIFILDDPSVITSTFTLTPPSTGGGFWPHDFPIRIIPPHWSFLLQGNGELAANFLYEFIFADELDFAYEL